MSATLTTLAGDIAFYLGVIIVIVFGGQFAWMVAGASGAVLWFVLLFVVGVLGRWFL